MCLRQSPVQAPHTIPESKVCRAVQPGILLSLLIAKSFGSVCVACGTSMKASMPMLARGPLASQWDGQHC